MSYNYDLNPWDDNYEHSSQNAGQPMQPNQPSSGPSSGPSGGYSAPSTGAISGYSNPVAAQYAGADSWNELGQYGDQQQQQPDYNNNSNQAAYQPTAGYQSTEQALEGEQVAGGDGGGQSDDRQQRAPAESVLTRFLRAHVPLCGPCLDLSSTICTPVLDTLFKYVNRDLLVSKIFYFFFYSAFGSLFPLMGVYFKQLGMNPAQVGILTGVRPFIEIFSAPFWSGLAERFQKGKALLLFSLVCWIVFTYSLAHIRPPASACIAFNDTMQAYQLYTPYSNNDLANYLPEPELDESAAAAEARGQDMKAPEAGPSRLESERERKDKALVVGDSLSVQGTRRRRSGGREKRQVGEQFAMRSWQVADAGEPGSRFVYSVEPQADSEPQNDGYSLGASLELDFERDFDDSLIDSGSRDGRASKQPQEQREESSSHLEREQEQDEGHLLNGLEDGTDESSRDDGELEANQGKSLWRFRRHADDDDLAADYESESHQPSGRRVDAQHGSKTTDESDGGGEEEEHEEAQRHQDSTSGERASKESAGEHEEKGAEERSEHEAATASERELGLAGESRPTEPQLEQAGDSKGPATSGGEQQQATAASLANGQNKSKKFYKQRHKTPPTHIVGMSPITVQYAVNYKKEKHSQFVTPMFSTIVYKLDDIKNVFFLLLLLISLGEFFSAPAVTIADSITLLYLGENTDHYGRQRAFGSLGWAITLLLVGMALDDSTFIAGHPCGPHPRERNYTVCYTIFSLLMACAFLTATQFNFQLSTRKNANSAKTSSGALNQTLIASTNEKDQVITTTAAEANDVHDLYAATRPREIFNTAPPINAPPPAKEKFEFLDKWKSAMFAQRTRELPEWVNVFRQFFRHPLHLTYLFITWFLGCGVGLVFTFLFWHLQEVGGTPTLFGICSVINHISEILAYFFSSSFIKRFGHTKVLSVGLGCNLIRFLYVAFLSNPYYALPFEFVQGITHAACFAACCSYMSHVSKPELKTSTQGVMQGLHHGIGRACGTILGGFMINAIGSRASFCIYGLLSGCVLGGFLYVRKRASNVEEEEVRVDDSEALGGFGAPQGVPSVIPGKITAQSVPQQEMDYQW